MPAGWPAPSPAWPTRSSSAIPDPSGSALVGVRSRGVPLARRLARLVARGERAPSRAVGALDITLYRDDFTSLAAQPITKGTDIPFSIDGRTVVLVDDVLYTGRTVRAALDELIDFGRPGADRARGARRPRPPRAADPRRLRRPHARDLARRDRAGAACSEEDGKDEVVLVRRAPGPRAARPRPKAPAGAREGEGRASAPHGGGGGSGELSAPAPAGHRAPRARRHPDHPRHRRRPAGRSSTGRSRRSRPCAARRSSTSSTRPRRARASSFEIAEKRALGRQPLDRHRDLERRRRARRCSTPRKNLEAMNPDMIVMRHACVGRAALPRRATAASSIVNAGDGAHEHPTQALLDALTMRQTQGPAQGAAGRDRRRHPAQPRGALEPVAARARWAPRSCCAARPPSSRPGSRRWRRSRYRIDEAVEGADVVMMLRIQLERMAGGFFPTTARVPPRLRAHRGAACERAKKDVLVMHPGPDEPRRRDRERGGGRAATR